jgi:hypothetical protein
MFKGTSSVKRVALVWSFLTSTEVSVFVGDPVYVRGVVTGFAKDSFILTTAGEFSDVRFIDEQSLTQVIVDSGNSEAVVKFYNEVEKAIGNYNPRDVHIGWVAECSKDSINGVLGTNLTSDEVRDVFQYLM